MNAATLAPVASHWYWTVTDTLVMARRNLLRYVRLPQLLVFSTIQPVMFILLFNYVFGGAIQVSMFALFIGGLRGTAPKAILEVTPNLQEARSHARTHHMPGDHLAPVR